MTSDADWEAMTPPEKNTLVDEVVFGRPRCKHTHYDLPDYISWPGFGLVVERMREKLWVIDLHCTTGSWQCTWTSLNEDSRGQRVRASADAAPSATALAAVRALEGKVKHD